MSDGQIISAIWAVGALVLVGSALASRRLPTRQFVTLALIWVAIFAVGALVVRLLGFE
jgi:aspartyl protease family protein